MVRLKESPAVLSSEIYLDFNSLMVRLKDEIPFLAPVTKAFQFLNGAIKRLENALQKINKYEFQFLNGAIKRFPYLQFIGVHLQFQFLNGAIKSATTKHTNKSKSHFNSLMVRLKVTTLIKEMALTNISIP